MCQCRDVNPWNAALSRDLARLKRDIAATITTANEVGASRVPWRHSAAHGPVGVVRRDAALKCKGRLTHLLALRAPARMQAHAAKEKALGEVAALKLQAEREHAAFEEEFRQLTAVIEDDRR